MGVEKLKAPKRKARSAVILSKAKDLLLLANQ